MVRWTQGKMDKQGPYLVTVAKNHACSEEDTKTLATPCWMMMVMVTMSMDIPLTTSLYGQQSLWLATCCNIPLFLAL